MTYNRGDRDDLNRVNVTNSDGASGGMIAGFVIAAIVVVGLLAWGFSGDRATVVRDGTTTAPNVTVQTPAPASPNVTVKTPAPATQTPPAAAPSSTGAASGTTRAPGTGQ
ncbi:MAG TPA: hypothetical protein VFV47_01965 [Hyphomicrobiaceae bacterium]|nr:hypothetical protein [Hyphomicrobiaceae bacterium]